MATTLKDDNDLSVMFVRDYTVAMSPSNYKMTLASPFFFFLDGYMHNNVRRLSLIVIFICKQESISIRHVYKNRIGCIFGCPISIQANKKTFVFISRAFVILHSKHLEYICACFR